MKKKMKANMELNNWVDKYDRDMREKHEKISDIGAKYQVRIQRVTLTVRH